MPIYRQAPTGETVSFADGTPEHIIDMVLKRDYSPPPPTPAPVVAAPPPPKGNDFDLGQDFNAVSSGFGKGLHGSELGIRAIARLTAGDLSPDKSPMEADLEKQYAAAQANTPRNPTFFQNIAGSVAGGFGNILAGGLDPVTGFAGQSAQEKIEEAKRLGITDPNKIRAAVLQNAVVGGGVGAAFEGLGPLAEQFNPFAKGLAHVAGETGIHSAGAGVLGGAQQFGGNVVTQQNFNPNQNLMEGVPESALSMAALGGVSHLAGKAVEKGAETVGGLFGKKPAKPLAPPIEPPPPGDLGGPPPGMETPAPHPDPAHPSNLLPNWNELPAGMQQEMLQAYDAARPQGMAPEAPQAPPEPAPAPEAVRPPQAAPEPSVQAPEPTPQQQSGPLQEAPPTPQELNPQAPGALAPPEAPPAGVPVPEQIPMGVVGDAGPAAGSTPEPAPPVSPPKDGSAELVGGQGPTLPESLSGAKPRFGRGQDNFTPQFDSDMDKALFITAQRTKSAADGQYRDWLKSLGYSDEQIQSEGIRVRKAIADQVRPITGGGDIKVGRIAENPEGPRGAIESKPNGASVGVDPDDLMAKTDDPTRPQAQRDENGDWHVEWLNPETGSYTRDYHDMAGSEIRNRKQAEAHAKALDQLLDDTYADHSQDGYENLQPRTPENILRDAGFQSEEIDRHQQGYEDFDQHAALAEKGWMFNPLTDEFEPASQELVQELKDRGDKNYPAAERQLQRAIENGQVKTPDPTVRIGGAPDTYASSKSTDSGWVRNELDMRNLEDAIKGKRAHEIANLIAQRNPNSALGVVAKAVERILKAHDRAGIEHRVTVVNPGHVFDPDPDINDLYNQTLKTATAFNGNLVERGGEGGHGTETIIKGSGYGNRSGLGDEIILHELIHAVTRHIINASKSGDARLSPAEKGFYKELQRIRNVALDYKTRREKAILSGKVEPTKEDDIFLDHNGKKSHNAFENEHELVSWALTDKSFQKWLEGVKDPNSPIRNMFNTFVQSIRELLGLPAQSSTALSSILHTTNDILHTDINKIKDKTAVVDPDVHFAKTNSDLTAPEIHEAIANGVASPDQIKSGELKSSGMLGDVLMARTNSTNGSYAGSNSVSTGKTSEMILRRAMMPVWQIEKGVLARSAKFLTKFGVSAEALERARSLGVQLGSDKMAPLAILQKNVLENGKVKLIDENTPLVASDLAPQTIQARVEAFRQGARKELTNRLNSLAPYANSKVTALARHLESLGFKDNVVRNFQSLKKSGVQTLAEAYAYAMHAEEANKYGLDILKKEIGTDAQGKPIYDPATSGMTDGEAKAIKAWVSNLPMNQREAIESAHSSMKFIVEQRERQAIQDGIMPDWKKIKADLSAQVPGLQAKLKAESDPFKKSVLKSQLDSVQKQINKIPSYENYVPLKSDVDSIERDAFGNPVDPANWGEFSGGGNGIGVKGKESQNRLGRSSYAGQITNNILNDYESSQTRGVRNLAGQKLMQLIKDGHDAGDEYIMKHFDKPGSIQPTAFKKEDGSVGYNVADYRNQADAFITKINGKEVYARIKTPDMMTSINGFDGTTGRFVKMVEGADQFFSNLGIVQAFGRAFHLLNAGLSVPFAARLIIKHTLVAGLNTVGLGRGLIKGMSDATLQKGISKHTLDVGRTFLGLRDDPSVKADLAELRANGGLFKPVDLGGIDNIQDHLDNIFAPKNFAEKSGRERWLAFQSGVHKLEQSMSSFTNHVEWTTRLAIFRTMKDHGLSPKEAAWYAQELTGNFGRKGLATRTLSTLYPFYNAGVQADNASMTSLLKAGVGAIAKNAAGLAAIGSVVAMYNYWMGDMHKDQAGNNPYALMPSYKRAGTSLAIQVPFMNQANGSPYYFKFPEPFKLFSIPVNAGAGVVAMMHGDLTPGDFAFDMTNESFSGAAHYSSTPTANPTVAATPGILRIPAALAQNKSELGSPIHPEFPTRNQKPPSQVYTKHASDLSIGLADLLHKGGLGEVYPDDMDYIAANVAGSAGSFVMGLANTGAALLPGYNASRSIKGQDKFDPITDNPVSGIFMGRLTSGDVANSYYLSVKDIKDYKERYKELTDSDDLKGAQEFRANHPKEASMVTYFNRVESEIKGNHHALKLVKDNNNLSVQDKVARAEHLNQASELAQRQFIYRWRNNGKYPDLSQAQ